MRKLLVWAVAGVLCSVIAPRSASATLTYYTTLSSFQAAGQPDVLEDFEDGSVTAGNIKVCSTNPVTSAGDANCFAAGEIPPLMQLGAAGPGGIAIFGPGHFENASIAAGAGAAGPFDQTGVAFDSLGAVALGMELYTATVAEDLIVEIRDFDGNILDDHVVHAVPPAGAFYGVVSTTPIFSLVVTSASDAWELLDDVRYRLRDSADLGVSLSRPSAPPGTVLVKIDATNNGPKTATGVVVKDTIPSGLAYVSDDCGGTNGNPWTWNVGGLASGATASCNITTTIVTPGGAVNIATISGSLVDPVSSNDAASDTFEILPAGPGTADPGPALFRSFPALVAPDETGTPFKFRDHADKLIVVMMCARWCGPCGQWTDKVQDLQAALTAAIGAQNFLLVDLLVDGQTQGSPSTQADAVAWKSAHAFPGLVLHAEGSHASPVYQLYNRVVAEYSGSGNDLSIPYFFILAPDCGNQVAVRGLTGLPGDPTSGTLGEEVGIDTADVTHVTQIASELFDQRRCVEPALHRLDRCSVGSAPISYNSITGDLMSAAESFVVPAEGMTVRGVDAVVDGDDDLEFDVTFLKDNAGTPGALTSCGQRNHLASTRVSGSKVRHIPFKTCSLPPGTYWMDLRVRDPATLPMWLGGVLPVDAHPFAFLDTAEQQSTGCNLNYHSAGDCLPAEAATQLCYVLDTANRVFVNGFESGAKDHWDGG